ncbi:MAG: class I SAM-dependent methyltransferase [Actinomycetota bacterium]|nr:class I SAM-dependent methyltransferase [Actinomycetota bacterium]
MNHEKLARLLRCPMCGNPMTYVPRAHMYCCEGPALHGFSLKDEIVDLVGEDECRRQQKVNKAFERLAGQPYERLLMEASWHDRFLMHGVWGTSKFIPLMFELLGSVTEDCEPGYFLDIPVGTGLFTAGEYSIESNLEFIAADFCRPMLESALEKVRAADFGNVMLVRADACSLPLVDDSFSGVLTMNGFGCFPDKCAAMDELVRVLKPGGKLAGSLYIKGERLLTDIIAGTFGVWGGYFSKPLFREEEFIDELGKRGVNNVVTRKVGSILFFSGRKRAPATFFSEGESDF